MAELRAGVIGHGSWGRVHLEAYQRNPHTRLTAVLGRDRQRTARDAAQYGATAYTDRDAFLGSGLDLVSVVLPDAEHFATTAAVLSAGLPCFAEKPLAMTLEEGRELIRLARLGAVPFGINFNHRFAPAMQRALARVREGAIGSLAYVSWKFTGGHFPERQPSLAHLLYMQSHGFNLLSTVGGEVSAVTCLGADPRAIGSTTTAAVTLRFTAGGIGLLHASVDASYNYPHIHTVEIAGLGGRVVVDDVVGSCTYHPAGSQTGEVWTPGFFDDDARSFARSTDTHIAAFVEALQAGAPVPVPAEEGLIALELGYAAVQACEEERVVIPTISSPP